MTGSMIRRSGKLSWGYRHEEAARIHGDRNLDLHYRAGKFGWRNVADLCGHTLHLQILVTSMSTTQSSIEDRVKKIVHEQMATYGATVAEMPNDYTLDAAGFDSLDLLEATMQIEDEFGIEIDDTVMWSTKSVGDFINAVQAAEAEHATTR
jgi:acyl carrier protein